MYILFFIFLKKKTKQKNVINWTGFEKEIKLSMRESREEHM
jgi:hypothetical protein